MGEGFNLQIFNYHSVKNEHQFAFYTDFSSILFTETS